MSFILKRQIRTYVLSLLLCLYFQTVAHACLSCGCGNSGSAADLGSMGSGSSLFSGGRQWLIQIGGSFRQITGSFNENGQWNPTPSQSALQTAAASLGVTYFPTSSLSLGLSLPVQFNRLDQASWGSFGSIAPTDTSASGGGLGDLQLQGSYTFWEANQIGLAAWTSLSLPTGRVDTDKPANLTGSGVANLSAGVMGVYRSPAHFRQAELSWQDWLTSRDWEILLNLGYSQALANPPVQASPFFMGQSLLYQVQGNLVLAPQWVLGLGLNGQLGRWTAGPDRWQAASRIKLVPSLQYEIDMNQGIRLSLGADLPVVGANQLTDLAGSLVYYQFFD